MPPDSSIFAAYQFNYKQSGPRDSSMRALALSLLLLTVLNLLSLKIQPWEEILAPMLKRLRGGGETQLSQILGCRVLRGGDLDNIFQGKKSKNKRCILRDFPGTGGWRLAFPGFLGASSSLAGCLFSPGLLLSGEEFIPGLWRERRNASTFFNMP